MIVPPNRCYIVGYNEFSIARNDMIALMDSLPQVRNWYTVLPGQMLIVSQQSTRFLCQLLRARFPNELFIVAEIHGATTGGALPPDAWEFINNPKSSGKWASSIPLSSMLAPRPPEK